MSFLAPFLIRILGAVVALACAWMLLAPKMSQPSTVYRNVDVALLVGGQLWPTLLLIAVAIVLATAIWLPLTALTARRGYHAGLTVAPVSVLAQAMAPFWLAALGLLAVGPSAAVAAGALAVVLLGFLAHATYLRAVGRQALAAESDGLRPDSGTVRLEIAEDWLDTIGRFAGLLIGALILVEAVLKRPGVGRFLVDGLRNADAAVSSVALFDLIAVAVGLTVLFGIGAEIVRARLARRRAVAPVVRPQSGARGSFTRLAPEPRWLALLTVALGGLILVVVLILATSADAPALSAQAGAALLPPGSPGHPFGTDALGRDLHARIAAGIRESLWQPFWLLFTAMFAVPFGLMAARLGRVVEGTLALLLNGLLTVSPFILVIAWLMHHPKDAGGQQVLLGYAIGPLLVVLIRDAVRAVWPGERRDAPAAFGALVMGLLVGASYALVIDASLRFLGLGEPRIVVPTLGEMGASGSILQARAPWMVVYPGLVLMALASSLILIGYGTLGLLRSRPAAALPPEDARQLAEA